MWIDVCDRPVITFLAIRLETLGIIGGRTDPVEHKGRLGSKIKISANLQPFENKNVVKKKLRLLYLGLVVGI